MAREDLRERENYKESGKYNLFFSTLSTDWGYGHVTESKLRSPHDRPANGKCGVEARNSDVIWKVTGVLIRVWRSGFFVFVFLII